jgi:hypothetical protein
LVPIAPQNIDSSGSPHGNAETPEPAKLVTSSDIDVEGLLVDSAAVAW